MLSSLWSPCYSYAFGQMVWVIFTSAQKSETQKIKKAKQWMKIWRLHCEPNRNPTKCVNTILLDRVVEQNITFMRPNLSQNHRVNSSFLSFLLFLPFYSISWSMEADGSYVVQIINPSMLYRCANMLMGGHSLPHLLRHFFPSNRHFYYLFSL